MYRHPEFGNRQYHSGAGPIELQQSNRDGQQWNPTIVSIFEAHSRSTKPYEPNFTFQWETAHCEYLAYLNNHVANEEQLELSVHCQQQAEFGRMDHTFGLLQLASCLLSIEERRSLRWLTHKAILILQAVRIDDFSALYAHIPRFDRCRPWLSVMPVTPQPPNPYPPNWLPVPCCVGDSLNSCGLSQHPFEIPSRNRFQVGTCMIRVVDGTHVAYWESGVSTEVLRTSVTRIWGFCCAHRTWKLPNCE